MFLMLQLKPCPGIKYMRQRDIFFLYNCVCSQVFDSPHMSVVSVILFEEVDQTYKSQLCNCDECISAAIVVPI